MNTISLRTNNTNDVTIISNIFIDNYMPTANGSYVKVYLYLLRCLTSNHINLSISTIADILEDTEKDILRAISYWEKVELITVSRDSNNTIINITFNSPISEASAPDMVTEIASSMDTPAEVITEPEPIATPQPSETEFHKPTYTKAQIEELSKDDTIRFVMASVESYMQRPLKPMDQQLILYLYESIGFGADLILYLYEYCISNNKKNTSYIEAVAISWASQGIDTEEKAKNHAHTYNQTFQVINKAFGLNRAPGDAEIKYISKWLNKYQLTNEVIAEACNRTLLRVGKPDFNYADKILESWAIKKVRTLQDITKLDDIHKQTSKKAASAPKAPAPSKPAPNKFNNFSQRSYSKEDFIKMEQLLLKKQ